VNISKIIAGGNILLQKEIVLQKEIDSLPSAYVWERGMYKREDVEDDVQQILFPFKAKLISIMPGKKWMTPEQLSFLESQIPDYLSAQSEHRLSDFYVTVSHNFFNQWSERQLRFPPKSGEETRPLSGKEQLKLSSFIIR
jgi:hypothetical protein